MTQASARPMPSSLRSEPVAERDVRGSAQVPLWQVNLLRVGYLVMGVGLAVTKWPLLFEHRSWGLMEGTVECMLLALSVLGLLGLRHPVRMLPILLFEIAWKVIWLGLVAVPLWANDNLEGATRDQAGKVLWVAIIIAVVPWGHVYRRFLTARGEPWLRRR
jgi:hypothetical protein